MTNIFIYIPILLEHRPEVAKSVFLGYHLTIESNISLLRGSTKITLHLLCFIPTKPKTFASKVHLHNSNFLSTSVLLIHQNYIICKEHTPRDITLYVSYDLIHHQSFQICFRIFGRLDYYPNLL
jgi:hypothetical protein